MSAAAGKESSAESRIDGAMRPGKGTRPHPAGGVHPPQPGWGGKKR